MSSFTPLAAPGIASARTTQKRNVFFGDDGILYLPFPMSIEGAKSRDPGNTDAVTILRAGTILGIVTSSKMLAPSIIGTTTNAEAIGSTTIEASAAFVTELVRRIGSSGTFTLLGPPSAGGAVSSQVVTYSAASGTSITCTALTKAFIAGSFIMPTDGSESPFTFVPDSYGIKVTDEDEANHNPRMPLIPIGGLIDSAQLINWPSDTSLRDWLAARLTQGALARFRMLHVAQ